MKRTLSLILVLLLALSLVACGGSKAEEPAKAAEPAKADEPAKAAEPAKSDAPADAGKKEYEITFVAPVLGNDYWNGVIEGVEDGAKEQGVKLNIVSPGAKSDVVIACDLCEAAIAAGVDGIVMGAYDRDAVIPVFQKATDAGIPVVTVDCDSPDSTRVCYCGTSNYNAGVKAGEVMAEKTGGKAKIIILTGSLTGDSAVSRMDGFKEAISKYPDMEILTTELTEGDALIAVQKAEACVQSYPEANAAFGVQVFDGPGMAQVAGERGLDMCIIGFDEVNNMLDAIRDGTAYATMVQQTHEMGRLGVENLVKVLNGETLPQEIYDTGILVVTKENVDTYK